MSVEAPNQTGCAVEPVDAHFRIDHLQADLKGRSVRGGTIVLLSQGVKFALQLGSTVVLARLLTPADHGLFALALAITIFFSLFNDVGLSLATVQQAVITHAQVSTLFWINAGLGAVMALLAAAAAPVVGWFYDEPRLKGMMLMLAFVFICVGVRIQHRALLRRQMRFGALAIIEIVSLAIGAAVAVVTAWRGAGYWALVWSQVATEATSAVGHWMACDWRPGSPMRHSGVRPMLAFGGYQTGNSLFAYVIRNTDNLLIGWRWGAGELGLYGKAYQLLILPLQHVSTPLSTVAVPVLSRLQDDPKRYREYFDKAVLLSAGLGMPLVAFLYVAADKAIPLVLGPQWGQSIAMFRALAPAAFVDTFVMGVGWTLVSMGQTRRQFAWTSMLAVLTVGCFVVGLPWGAVGVATAFSACRVAMAVPTLIYGCRNSPLRWAAVLRTVSRPAIAAIAAAGGLAILGPRLPALPALSVGLLADGMLYAVLYLATWIVLPNGRRTLAEIWHLTRSLWLRPEAQRIDV